MHAIGQAARLSGVSIETIRYYEREGIVPKPIRAGNGRRLYDDEAIAKLRFVRRCRDLGFPLADATALLEVAGQEQGCADVRKLGEKHLKSVRAKIADLIRLETALEQLIEPCETPHPQCQALETLFAPALE